MRATAASPQSNPFPGLRPFREDEEHLFFGRENQVDAMVDKLAATRFLAVVGTSGSGKSSLVNCGLRPALRQGLMAPAGTAWRMAQFRPGNDPIGAMARALAQDGVLFREQAAAGMSMAEIIETTLRMSKLGLIDIREQAALERGRQPAAGGGSIRGTVSLPAGRQSRQQGRRENRGCRRLRESAAGGQGTRGPAHLCRADDAIGLSRRLHPVSRAGRGHQCGPVSGAANDPGRAPRRHRGADPVWAARRSRRCC